MFNNITIQMIGVCLPKQPKEWQYAAMLQEGAIPIVYISRAQMENSDEVMYKSIINQIPETTGIVIPVTYNQLYE